MSYKTNIVIIDSSNFAYVIKQRKKGLIYKHLNRKNMSNLLFIGGIGIQEIVFIALIVLLFFGGKKIPELMKGLGKGIKSFKDGVSGLENESSEQRNDN